MIVNEIFCSLQGEGMLAGTPSVFVRLANCPLKCRWCDTKYACTKNDGTNYSISDIVQKVSQTESKYIVITGGEPMVNFELPLLVEKLKVLNRHITIETSGISFVPAMDCDLMSISPKLSNSTPDNSEIASIHNDLRLNIAALGKLIDSYNYQLKFVVDSIADLKEIKEVLKRIKDVTSRELKNIMLMPQAKTRAEFLSKMDMVSQMCVETGFSFCQRLHVLLWDGVKGR